MSWIAKVFLISSCIVSALGMPVKENDWRTQFRQLISALNTKCPNYYFYHSRYHKNISCSEVCPYQKTQDIKIKYCFDNCRDYLRCVANILPNGSRVVTELFRDEIPSNHTAPCPYRLFYHPKFGFSYCADICAGNEDFCSDNCPGYFNACRGLPQRKLMPSSEPKTGHEIASSFSVTPSVLFQATSTSAVLAGNTVSDRVMTATPADSWLPAIALSVCLLVAIVLIIVVVLFLRKRRCPDNRRKNGQNEENQPQAHGNEEQMVPLAADGRNVTQNEKEQAPADEENARLNSVKSDHANPSTGIDYNLHSDPQANDDNVAVASVLQDRFNASNSASMCHLNDRRNSTSASQPVQQAVVYRQPVQESSPSENKHADGEATGVKYVANDDEEPALNDSIVSLKENEDV